MSVIDGDDVPVVVPLVAPPDVSVGTIAEGGMETLPLVPLPAPAPLFEIAASNCPSTVPGSADAKFCPVVAVVAVVVFTSPVTSGFGLVAGMAAVPEPIGAAVGFDGAVVVPATGKGAAAIGFVATGAGVAAGACATTGEVACELTGLKSASTCAIHDDAKTDGLPCS